MSFIGSMFNAGQGAGFQANQGPLTPNIEPADATQYNSLFNQGQGNLNQQQALVTALQGQNGVANQSNVFAQQQALANQLQQQAAGGGPNPAQAQLAQNTAANTQNQAALMASGRGASANAGLLARNAAEQGASNQQQAAGQAATLQAQQQLAAQGALANQQQALAQGAQTQVGNLQGSLNSQAGATQGLLGQTGSQINAQNQVNSGMAQNVNNTNAGIAGANIKAQQGVLGGGLSALGAAAGMGFAHGGMVPQMYADGGTVATPANVAPPVVGGSSRLKQAIDAFSQQQAGQVANDNPVGQGFADLGKGLVQGYQKMQATPSAADASEWGNAQAAADATPAMDAAALAGGGAVPGKAKKQGDSLQNDTVPAMLSPGEVVIPRHIMQGKNPAADAAKFVAAIMARHGGGQQSAPKRRS